MNINTVKEQLFMIEQTQKRMPAYELLRSAWHRDPSEALTVLVMQQMLDDLDWLDGAYQVEIEQEDECDLYQALLLEAIEYGLEHYRYSPLFCWTLCYYLNSWSTWYWVLGKSITAQNAEQIFQELIHGAKERYPDSALFDMIPYGENLLWKNDAILKRKIQEQTSTWFTGRNMTDVAFREMLTE